ncbi:hypothetical protein D3D01_21880 [Haloarcula sp. Atlit-7R]|nr:hypothetical protein D3D01_21880 [Haloarcula sp. Atlit-7R]
MYVLTPQQYERHEGIENGYAIKGESSIAKELQDECESDDRVLYPIHIESDVYHEEGPATLIRWFREFVEDYLGVSFHSCTLYFSGNRSIHVHVPRFVSGENQRERLKELAETFCTETGAELDCGLYYAKRMFRLPGVEHAKTGLQKVKIEPEWNHERIFREADSATTEVPDSYADVLQQVFVSQESLTVNSLKSPLDDPLALFRVLDGDKTVLEIESDNQEIETPLIEQEQYPDNTVDAIKWLQYNAKEFSPYALAGNGRSVAVVRVKGGAFARKDVRNGTALVPVYFYGAQGCAGEEFTKADEHAPLQLSKRDYKKWDYKAGDNVVIIGGQSRNSRIFRIEPQQAAVVGHTLTDDDPGRQAALDYLQSQGYDVGKAGTSGNTSTSKTTGSEIGHNSALSMRGSQTEVAALQEQAEQGDIETLSHMEKWRVACRLLKWGWEPAWEWFKKQFGANFKPEITREQFESIIQTFPEDYDHIKVPPQQ